MTFEEFKANPRLRNQWLREPGLDLYVRRSVRLGIEFDLANMDADEPGKGALTRFLDRYDAVHVFYVESIQNPRLAAYLARRGYVVVPTPGELLGVEINMRNDRTP